MIFLKSLRKTHSSWWFSQVCSIKTVEVRKLTDALETETMIIEIPMPLKLILVGDTYVNCQVQTCTELKTFVVSELTSGN